MAITTLDGLIAGMQPPDEFYKIGAGTQVVGRQYSLLYAAGMPGAAAAPAPGLQGIGLTTYPGQLDWSNPVAGNTYLARFAGEASTVGTLLLCDRLWHNSGNSSTSTSAQTHTLTASAVSQANPTQITTPTHGQGSGTFTVVITGSNSTPSVDGTYTATYVSSTQFTIPVNVTVAGTTATIYIGIPPRDEEAAVDGSNVMLAYEVSSGMGGGTPTFTATYVNAAGTADKVTPSVTFAASHPIGTFIPLPLAAGDTGVRAVKDHTKNATQTSGTYHLVMYRVISRIPVIAATVSAAVDAITAGMPKLHANSVPFLVFICGSTTAPNVSGQIIYSQG